VAELRLIAGSGRSGTTWVQDALAQANGLRPVFEPLHPNVSAIGNRFAHRALAPEDDQPELAQFLRDVCDGREIHLWTKYRRQRHWLFPPFEEFRSFGDASHVYRRWRKFLSEMPRLAFAARRTQPLIKCIRANLMLGWLSRSLGCRTVLIVRHPAAVIESELRSDWKPDFALERFKGDVRLHEITNGRYRPLLDRPLERVEGLAARWVVENQWVIERANANGITVVFYEALKSSPESEWNSIRHALGLDNAPPEEVFSRPSQQSAPKQSAATSSVSEPPGWMVALTREQLARIQAVLDFVSFNLYSVDEPGPRACALPEQPGRVAGAAG